MREETNWFLKEIANNQKNKNKHQKLSMFNIFKDLEEAVIGKSVYGVPLVFLRETFFQ